MDRLNCHLWAIERCHLCPTCILEDFGQLPFCFDVPCPIEDHHALLERLIARCDHAYSAILRMTSIAKTNPERVNLKVIPRILKKQLLLASLALYDSAFFDFLGPEECNCPIIVLAQESVKRLHDCCVVANINTDIMWSYMLRSPRPIHTVFY